MLGDILNDDYHYTGEDGGSAMTAQYYRNKITEFQQMMNALDAAHSAVAELLATGTVPMELSWELDAAMIEFESRKGEIQFVAESISAATSALNAVGVRMPQLSIPSGLAGNLGIAPVVMWGALAAAMVTVSALMAFAQNWIETQLWKIDQYNRAMMLPEEARPAFIAAQQKLEVAKAQSSSILGAGVSIAKWLAIGVAAIAAFKLLKG